MDKIPRSVSLACVGEKVCEEHDGEAGHVHYRLMPYVPGEKPRNWLNHEGFLASSMAPSLVNHEWVLHVPFFPIMTSPPLKSSMKTSLSITSGMFDANALMELMEKTRDSLSSQNFRN